MASDDNYRFHALDSLYLPFLVLVSLSVHAMSYFAYGWEPGMDFYSYDAAGLQLVTGLFFDPFPVLFRPPLVPLVKNLLYLVFDGRPEFLCIFLHLLGVATSLLVFRLGARFRLWIGFAAGMVFSLVPDIAFVFHSVSSLTLFLPLLLLAADSFVLWCRKPSVWRCFLLGLFVFLCAAARAEAVLFVPFWFVLGYLAHKRAGRAFFFGMVFFLLYNSACFFYWQNFGRWAISSNTGWSLFNRVSRKADEQFSISFGPAARRLYECMRLWVPDRKVSADKLIKNRFLSYSPGSFSLFDPQLDYLATASLSERQMYSLNSAQEKYGFQEADDIFFDAALESVLNAPGRYTGATLFRFFCALGLYEAELLRHDEGLFTRADLQRRARRLEPCAAFGAAFSWKPARDGCLPLAWEREVMAARVLRAFGREAEVPRIPDVFMPEANALFEEGGIFNLSDSTGVMAERLRHCLVLESFFSDYYWGGRYDRAFLVCAVNCLLARDWLAAQAMCAQSLRLNRFNAETHVRMAVALRMQGKDVGALQYLERALVLMPGHEDACIQQGLILLRYGDFADALESFSRALATDPHTKSARALSRLCSRALEEGGAVPTAGEIEAALGSELGLVRPDVVLTWQRAPSEVEVTLCMLSREGLYILDRLSAPFSFSCIWFLRALFVMALFALFLARDRNLKCLIAAMLAFVLLRAAAQAAFDDNFGGRFFIYAFPFMLVCGMAGIDMLVQGAQELVDQKREEAPGE